MTDSLSFCLIFLSSSLAWFMVGASEKLDLSLNKSWSSVHLSLVMTTLCTAPVDFFMILVLKSHPLILHAWLISSIQSSNCHLSVPSHVLIEANIASFALSLLALVSSLKASCWLLWLATMISSDLDCMLARSISVVLRSWPGMEPSGEGW